MITEKKLKSIFKKAKLSNSISTRLAKKLLNENNEVSKLKKKLNRKHTKKIKKQSIKFNKPQFRKLSKKAKRVSKKINKILKSNQRNKK